MSDWNRVEAQEGEYLRLSNRENIITLVPLTFGRSRINYGDEQSVDRFW